MKIILNTLEFFIGAYTRVNRPNNWVWPGRSVPFLYQRKFRIRTECSIEPDVEVWRQFGMAVFDTEDKGTFVMSFTDFADKVVGPDKARALLGNCPGLFLYEGKGSVLDRLGCPHDAT